MSIALMAVLGLAVGSFLNVCIDRLPRGESLAFPSSHCEACGHRLGGKDLVPVLSYVWLKGHCRYCGASFSARLPLVEAITGGVFAFLTYRYGLTLSLAIYLFYASLFTVIFVIDLEQGIIPNILVYPALGIALLLSALLPGASTKEKVMEAAVGGITGFWALLLPYLIYRGGMGAGDVKLAALVGIAAGFPGVFVALLLAIVVGGVAAALLLVTGRRSRKGAIPFGPFLTAGGMVALLWGDSLWRWYATWWV